MKPILVLGTFLLAACAGDAPPEAASPPAADTALAPVPVAGAIQEVQRRADEVEAALAERARQAEEQAQAAGSPP